MALRREEALLSLRFADMNMRILDFLRVRQSAYVNVFRRNPSGNVVLRDLAKFCKANQSCFHPDARMHAVFEGRREVFQRISDHLGLNTEDLYSLYHPSKPTQE